jgi:hypothetical protein
MHGEGRDSPEAHALVNISRSKIKLVNRNELIDERSSPGYKGE